MTLRYRSTDKVSAEHRAPPGHPGPQRRGPPRPSAAAPVVVVWLALDRAGGQTADEEPLERDEYQHRDDHADDRAGRQQLPALVLGADQAGDGHGDDLTLARAEEQQGDQQVVPDPQELEDGERGQRW